MAILKNKINIFVLLTSATLFFCGCDNDEENTKTIKFKGLEYNVITSPITNKQWLDRNLGATQVCTSSSDKLCYGDYYQWGRLSDGHEKYNSNVIFKEVTSISNVWSEDFITSSYEYNNDWAFKIDSTGSLRIIQWNKVDGTSICPKGFYVPTMNELKAETLDYSGINNLITGAVKVKNSTTAFENFLKLPTAGGRDSSEGLFNKEPWGILWTNSIKDNSSYIMDFNNREAKITQGARTLGFPVRCIKKDNIEK